MVSEFITSIVTIAILLAEVKQHAEQQQKTVTFSAINAHFQNGITDRAIQDITKSARKQLLHVKKNDQNAYV